MAVGAELPLAVGRPARADASVVDQQREGRGHPVCQSANLLEGRQVGEHGLGGATGLADLIHHGGRALGVAAVHQDVHPLTGERNRDRPAQARGRTRH